MLQRAVSPAQPLQRVYVVRELGGSRGRRLTAPALALAGADLRDEVAEKELSTDYDPEALEAFFKARPGLVLGRVWHIARSFLGLYLSSILNRNMGKPASPSSDVLCKLAATLGPTFVKLGQTLSTREDLIGKDLARALSDLQMAAPPFDNAIAVGVIRAELGDEPQNLYSVFSGDYVAAASLGQVYRGQLPGSGDPVAIKVQRPDLLGSIALDVYVLRGSLGLFRRFARINSDIRNIADEVGKGLFAELDYDVEADQAAMFATAHSHLPYIDTVEIVRPLSTRRVLTTRWIDGVCPTDLLAQSEATPEGTPEHAAIRRRLVNMVNLGIECSLSQLLETGVMHADPHPGNLILTEEDRLAYLDFGLLTFVPVETSEAMMGCLVHVALGKWRDMADDLGRMGFLKPNVDRNALAVSLEKEVVEVWPLAGSFGVDSFLADGSAGGALSARLADGTVRPELGLAQGLTFGKLAKAIIKLAIKYRFNLPPYYTLIVRSLCSLEGLALRVDPAFSIVNAAIPIILRRLLTDTRPAAIALLRELLLEDDKRLRLGMLEGLLKNYSAEAGMNMQQSSAANVVLKGPATPTTRAASPAVEQSMIATRQLEAATSSGAGAARAREMRSGSTAGGSHRGTAVLEAPTSLGGRGGSSNGANGAVTTASAPGFDIESHAVHADGTDLTAQDRASNGASVSSNGASVSSNGASASSNGASASPSASLSASPSQANPSEEPVSFEAQVLQMGLSAHAAGVRRVLLEADMKDIVNQLSGPSGESMRDKAVEELAKVVTWSLVLKSASLAVFMAVRSVFTAVLRFFRLHRLFPRRKRHRAGKLSFKGAELSAVALKRAQLYAMLSFAKLWRQSWRAAIASMWLGLVIVSRALNQRPRPQTAA